MSGRLPGPWDEKATDGKDRSCQAKPGATKANQRVHVLFLGLGERGVAEAGGVVVVDHAGGLHEGVADGGTDEAEAAALKVFAHGV